MKRSEVEALGEVLAGGSSNHRSTTHNCDGQYRRSWLVVDTGGIKPKVFVTNGRSGYQETKRKPPRNVLAMLGTVKDGKHQCEGRCPVCKAEWENSDEAVISDYEDGEARNFTCENCGTEFHEFFSMEYQGTTIDEIGGVR